MSAAPTLAFVPWKEGAIRVEIDRDHVGGEIVLRIFVMRGAKWIVVDESALDKTGIRKVWPDTINNAIRVQK